MCLKQSRWNQIWWFSGNQSLGFSGNLTVGCRKSRREPGHSKESQLLWTGPFLESIWLIVSEMIFLKRYILGKIFFFKYLLNFDIKELQTCWVDAPGPLHCLRLWFPCNRHRRRFAPGKNVTFDHLTFRFSETINYLLALCYIFICTRYQDSNT